MGLESGEGLDLPTIDSRGIYVTQMPASVDAAVRANLIFPLPIQRHMPHESKATSWQTEFNLPNGLDIRFDSTGIGKFYAHIKGSRKWSDTLVGLGWMPGSGEVSKDVPYRQIILTPLVPEKGLSVASLDLGYRSSDARIYLPEKPWPLEELRGELIVDILEESVLYTGSASISRSRWAHFLER